MLDLATLAGTAEHGDNCEVLSADGPSHATGRAIIRDS